MKHRKSLSLAVIAKEAHKIYLLENDDKVKSLIKREIAKASFRLKEAEKALEKGDNESLASWIKMLEDSAKEISALAGDWD